MGISPAMTPKERKQIYAGLVDQGAVVDREGKRGTLFKVPSGGRWMLPYGTSDHKARLAMRAEVRRLGLRWPLDPPEQKKREHPMTEPETTAEGPTLTTHEREPKAVERFKANNVAPLEKTYRQSENLLHEFATKTFWTDEFSKIQTERGVPGYAHTGAAQRQAQILLDFAGFRVIESKLNRGGYSYRWRRDPLMPWPTEFAPTMRGATAQRETPPPAAPSAEPTPPAAETASQSDDDTELALAVEQEQRAIRAERERDGLRVSLDQEKSAHAQTRRDLMVRIANWERKFADSQAEIARLRSIIEEERAAGREAASGDSATALRRAHHAEQQVQQLQEELSVATRALAHEARTAPAAVPQGDNEWWPLEGFQPETQAIARQAAAFGLTIRVQARRKAD